MRILLIHILLFSKILTAQTKKSNEFILKGKINGLTEKYIYFISYNNDEVRFVDSIKVVNGNFVYKGSLNGYLDRFYIKLNPADRRNNDSLNNLNLPIDNSVMNINLQLGSFSKFQLTGCKTCDLLKTYNLEYKKRSEISENFLKWSTDSSLSKSIRDKYRHQESLNWEKFKSETFQWCLKNPSNSLTPYNLCAWAPNITLNNLAFAFEKLDNIQKESFFGTRLKKIIDQKVFAKKQLGQSAYSFTNLGYNGDFVSLKDVNKNRYILLDFWASWCKPCRVMHPKLISLYKKYQNVDFQIVGISVDEDISKWKEAIKSDSIFLWPNILNMCRDNKIDIKDRYFISEYPTKILIDMKGKIIARYVGDNFEALENKLNEIFKY